jgi:nucleotide-binding universal stress UspA family protein
MTTYLMPTRGGPASYPNQDGAIALARAEGARLVFLYVANARFLKLMMSPVLVDMEAEMEELGGFLLAMAQERALQAGVEAEALVLRGLFRNALREAITATEADVVLLGTAANGTGITTPTYREELIEELIAETGVGVIVLDNGEIAARYGPASQTGESAEAAGDE